MDLWSYKDQVIQPMQKVQADAERSRTYRGVAHLSDGRYVQLATLDLPIVNPGDDPGRAIGTSSLPYRMEVSWDQTYNDVYIVDLQTGKPTKVLEHWGSATSTLSPGGKYVLYFDENAGHWWTYRASDGQRTNLTERLKVRFQQDFTTPDLPGPYGTGGWTADDQSLLLYDEFDVWEVKPDGTGARMITSGAGRKQALNGRARALDTEERTVPTDKPMLLATTNEHTRATGFYRVGYTGRAAPEKLVMQDRAFGALTKAAKADSLVFTLSRFEEFPDLWVTSDLTFKDMKKVSNANPQQAQYIWGKSELIEYLNGDGRKLKAILTKPENFDPSKKYPLMVYIYEGLSQNLHNYSTPNVGTSIIPIRYVSNGYVLLQPDIVYETGFPGESAEKCVIPAVNTVVAQGYIDPKRIGIQGHSWGAYQITHMITRTDIFSAVEAGAAVSNMISAYGGIRWGTGMVREFQYEKTQSRIGAPPWDAPLLYIENSPIFWIKNIHTPYLTIHNDGDDAVPWYQGIEFNTAMRRLGKEAYMFNYNGEPHGLRNRDNMKNWTVHMDEFFDHYLLGKPRPEWMDTGVSYLDRGKRNVAGMFKKK
jgi:dipeptidyl aminopeptidase/acylaminoacyl peptidase